MSEDERNTLTWPSIEQLPREVCSRLRRFFDVADAAATAIQRAHRHQARDHESEIFRGGYHRRLHAWLLDSPVTTSEKLDGTNVGKLRDGTLLGRRLVIDPSASHYQRCELSALRAHRTERVLDDLALGACATLRRAALYGELCCNAGLYNYKAAGVAKTWQAFGALLEFEDEATAETYATAAADAALVCRRDGAVVKVCNSAAFGEVARRHDVPVVASTQHASLCAAVMAHAAWMVGEHGEGLVLSVRDRERASRTSLYKWKISREPQPAAREELAALREALYGAEGKAVLLDGRVLQLVEALYAVSMHVDSTAGAAAAAAKPVKTKVPRAAIDPAAVASAIASALTKFDSLEASFDAHGQTGVGRVTERLVAEVLADAELPLPAAEGEEREAAIKAVAAAVKKQVGQAYGAWRRTTAASAA